VSDRLKASGLNAKVLLQVHDELVLECPENEMEEAAQLVRTVMESAYTMKIPLQTEARFGLNWGTMNPLNP
jgi:DNA polymerase-1